MNYPIKYKDSSIGRLEYASWTDWVFKDIPDILTNQEQRTKQYFDQLNWVILGLFLEHESTCHHPSVSPTYCDFALRLGLLRHTTSTRTVPLHLAMMYPDSRTIRFSDLGILNKTGSERSHSSCENN